MPWSDVEAGVIGDSHEVAFATNDDNGHSLLADGDSFAGGHDHYGGGDGPNNNGTDRGSYTGPGSKD